MSGTLMIRNRPDDGPEDMTMKATFDRIAEQDDKSAHDRLVELVLAYKLEHPERTEAQAQMACFTAYPKLHREYLNSNGSF